MDRSATNRLPLAALLIAGAISLIGDQMLFIALPWFVLQTTGSPALTGLAGAAVVLPSFIAGVLGGTLVDRLGYRRVSLLADSVSGVGVALIPLLHFTVGLAFWQLLVLVFIGSLMAVPGLTARRAMIPEIATQAGIRLERVNAAFEGLQNIALLIGPPLAGLLIVWLGPTTVLWIDAASFGLSAILVAALVHLPLRAPGPTGGRYMQELRAGLRFLRQDKLLLTLAISLATTNFFSNGIFFVVLPVYAQRVFGAPTDLGLLMAAFGLGSLVGVAIYGAIGHRLPRRATWIGGYWGFALLIWMLFPLPALPVAATAVFIQSMVGGPLNPLLVTVRHERIPAELRGRVFSTFSAIAMIATPLGIALAGLLIERIGLQPTILAMACGYTLICVAMLLLPVLKELDESVTR
jgi:MFS family permease